MPGIGHGITWKGEPNEPGRGAMGGQNRFAVLRRWLLVSPHPVKAPARNGVLLYTACAMYSCVLRSCCLGSLAWQRPWVVCVALLRPRGGAPCAALRLSPPDTVSRFPPAGHAKHGVTPSGVFTGRKADGPGLGETPTSVSGCPKGYPDALLAYVIAYSLNPAPMHAIIRVATS